MMMMFMGINAWAEEYSFTIQTSDFNTTSYAANNGSHDFTATCTTDASKTMTVACTTNQIMKKDGMQWQKSNGYVYNTTDLGTIKSVTVNSSDGTFTTYYGTSEHPTSGTTVGGGFFTVKVGSATGNTSSIVVVFEKNSGDNPVTVTAPKFDVAAGTYTEDQLVLVENYNNNYLYFYTTDGTTPACDEELNATGTSQVYDNEEGIEVTESCTLKMIAVDEDGNTSSVTSAAYVINKPIVFTSLEELVAADITTGTIVSVSFKNVPIKSIFTTSQNKRNGVYFDIQKGGKDIEIYYYDVPEEWEVGGTLSGTMTCPWKLYNGTWELAPASGWSWTNLTYKAPVQKTITALAVSGTPTKTVYNVGDVFDPAGLVVTATYSDESTATITSGFEWEIDYGTGNENLVEGTTSVDVMAYIENVMSEVYTVNGLTVNVPVVLSSISVSGTPTKTAYYDGDVFETDGLVVTGHYSDGSDKEITEGIEWTVDPETLTLETTTVDVIAGIGLVVSEVYTVNVTVAENPYKTASVSSFSENTYGFMNNDIYYEARQGESSTAPAVYNNCLRLYQNGGYVNITAATGLKINSVKITTSSTYASTTVGYCVDDEDAPTKGVTVAKSSDYKISNLNNNSVSIYCLGTDNKSRLEISAIEVKYSGEAAKELRNIALSGTYPTEFTKGDEFSHEGMVVTATYSDATEKDVTSSATFTGYDMNTIGEQTVTVSYTEENVTKTAEYKITVNKAPFIPVPVEEGYEIVNFTTISPYKDLAAGGNAAMEEYEGTSFLMTFAKKDGTNNAPKYYENGKAVRAYVDNTVTITAAEPITDVNVAWSPTYIDDAVQINGIGTTTAVITFSKTCRFTAIGVAYASEAITTNANGVASYVTSLPADFTNVEGLTAYLCTETSSEAVTLEKAGKVPAGTALVVVGGKSTSYDLPFTASATAVDNLFLAGEYTVQEGDYVYALNTQGQFQKVGTGVTIPARKAYLKTEEALSKTISIFDVDETTGIASVNNEAVKTTARKVIVNGQLRIVTPNGMFTTTGAQVK